jgi:cell division protein FtsW
LQNIKGDLGIWGVFGLLVIFSFLPMYSASSFLVNVMNKGTTSGYLVKHAFIVSLGVLFVYGVHKIPYRYFSGGSALAMPLAFLLMVYTLAQGTTIAGATAARWIVIPIIGMSFQTSTFASLVVMIYTARYLSRRKNQVIDFKDSFIVLWLPVGLIIMSILPSNFSTAALLFTYVSLLMLIGGYPFRHWMKIAGMGLLALVLFIFVGRAFSSQIRVKTNTWKNRIINHGNKEAKDTYQVDHAKMAIATGGLIGKGVGKSRQRNFLPQSTSDFIYAIIIEEYGMLGAIIVVFLYMWLLFRFYVVAKKAQTVFATLLVIGVGFPIIIQATINMLVAANIVPVTGQTLPMLSSGGSSIWMTCIAIGIVLSVSAAGEEDYVINKQPEEDNPLDVLYETVE